MLTSISNSTTQASQTDLWLLHESTATGAVSGNKRFKLQPHIAAARSGGYSQLLSFGGAYSNHIHALALAAKQHGLSSVGIIRGEAAYATNPTLTDATRWGMQLEFVTRGEYRKRHDPVWLEAWQDAYPKSYLVPEGGSSLEAARACQQMFEELPAGFLDSTDTLVCAVGTGATFAGLHSVLTPAQQACGYQVVRDPDTQDRINHWANQLAQGEQQAHWQLRDAGAGTYGKLSGDQLAFIDSFYQQYQIVLDPLYTSRLLLHLMSDIEHGQYPRGTRILAVHTGGLQGWRGQLERNSVQLSAATLDIIRQQSDMSQL